MPRENDTADDKNKADNNDKNANERAMFINWVAVTRPQILLSVKDPSTEPSDWLSPQSFASYKKVSDPYQYHYPTNDKRMPNTNLFHFKCLFFGFLMW